MAAVMPFTPAPPEGQTSGPPAQRPCRRARKGSRESCDPSPSSPPSLSAPASAWADSIAGKMPSVRHSRRERVHGLGIRDGPVFRAADRRKPRVLRSNAGVVEPRADRVGLRDLTVAVLEDVRARAVQHACASSGDGRRVPSRLHAVARRLAADQAHAVVVEKRVKDADRVGAAANTRNHSVGQAAQARAAAHAPRGR